MSGGIAESLVVELTNIIVSPKIGDTMDHEWSSSASVYAEIFL